MKEEMGFFKRQAKNEEGGAEWRKEGNEQEGVPPTPSSGARAADLALGRALSTPPLSCTKGPSDPMSSWSSSPPRPLGYLLPSRPQWLPVQVRLPGSVLDKVAGGEGGRGEGGGHILQESLYALHGVKSTPPPLPPRAESPPGCRKASNSKARSCLKETAEQISVAAPNLCFSWPFTLLSGRTWII